MKRIHLLTGEEQITFREKDVSKDSDASKEKKYTSLLVILSHTPSLCSPIYWVEDSCFLCYQKAQNIF